MIRLAVSTLALALALATAACTQVREARAVHPNPAEALKLTETLPVSARLDIFQRDMNMGRDDKRDFVSYRNYQLRSSAQFTVVSKERVRFHVTVTRWAEDEADLANWTAYVVDEAGRRYDVTSREGGKVNRISVGWGLYPSGPGDTFCPQPPCKTRIDPPLDDVYEGEADYMFRYPDMLRDRKSVTLVMQHGPLQYRYKWSFGEGWQVENYGRTRVDDEMGIIIVPGPDTEIAGTRYEGEHW